MNKEKKKAGFWTGWLEYFFSHSGLVTGIWVPQDVPPAWGFQVIATVVNTPVAILLGTWLSTQPLLWVIGSIFGCHLFYTWLSKLEFGALNDVQLVSKDIVGRFVWLVANTTAIVGLWRLITYILF